MAQRRTQRRKARPHCHEDQIVAFVIFYWEAMPDYIFQNDLPVGLRSEERRRPFRRFQAVFDQELELILFRGRREGHISVRAIVDLEDRHLAGLELGAWAALRNHEEAPDRVCVFVYASNA
jgi:hypothetical protein